MCGIVGAVTRTSEVGAFLVQGLAALEYRGYDSVGIALHQQGHVERLRTEQRVRHIKEELAATPRPSSCGIGHTRWATHGAPSVRNAHPHRSHCTLHEVYVVHNGIIENHESLRAQLQAQGYCFESDTDTEVVAHLVHSHLLKEGDLGRAFHLAVKELHGLFAIAVISKDHPDVVYATRQGAPLLLGVAPEGHYLASDVSALLAVTNRVVYLEDGDVAVLTPEQWHVESVGGSRVHRQVVLSELSAESVELGPYQHYMQKEIAEQPEVLADTLAGTSVAGVMDASLFGPSACEAFDRNERVLLLACGTSYHAAMVMRYWIERMAKVPAQVEVASEFRYREPVVQPGTLVVTVSQSGETADTRAVLEYVQALGVKDSLSICNVPESALQRLSSLRFLTRAGAEIGVASTKAFTTQLVAGYLLALALAARKKMLDEDGVAQRIAELRDLPRLTLESLHNQDTLKRWAKLLSQRQHALFLGRSDLHPIAMEGALKLKEISYIHAEAYSAGELKNGPLALIDEHMPVVVSVARNELLDKVKANIEEVLARKGEVFVVCDPGCEIAQRQGLHVLELPVSAPLELSSLVHVLPLQQLAYLTALERGTDVDKPRNLAKSVTVE